MCEAALSAACKISAREWCARVVWLCESGVQEWCAKVGAAQANRVSHFVCDCTAVVRVYGRGERDHGWTCVQQQLYSD